MPFDPTKPYNDLPTAPPFMAETKDEDDGGFLYLLVR